MATELTPKQLRAAEMLGSGSTKKAAAEDVCVTVATINRWLDIPEFKDARARAIDKYIGDIVPDAVNTLASMLEEESPWIRMQGARAILSLHAKRNEGDASVTVSFTGVPKPGMPDEEQFISGFVEGDHP